MRANFIKEAIFPFLHSVISGLTFHKQDFPQQEMGNKREKCLREKTHRQYKKMPIKTHKHTQKKMSVKETYMCKK